VFFQSEAQAEGFANNVRSNAASQAWGGISLQSIVVVEIIGHASAATIEEPL
jgi:hypothetical protein